MTSVDSDGVKNVAGTAVLIAVRTPFYGANDTTFDAGFVPEIVLSGAGQSLSLFVLQIFLNHLCAVIPAFANITVNVSSARSAIQDTLTSFDAAAQFLGRNCRDDAHRRERQLRLQHRSVVVHALHRHCGAIAAAS